MPEPSGDDCPASASLQEFNRAREGVGLISINNSPAPAFNSAAAGELVVFVLRTMCSSFMFGAAAAAPLRRNTYALFFFFFFFWYPLSHRQQLVDKFFDKSQHPLFSPRVLVFAKN